MEYNKLKGKAKKMKVTKSGEYLKAEAVKNGSMVTFLDEGNYETSDKYKYEDGSPKQSLVFKVSYDGQEKKLRVNTASKTSLIDAYGDDTKDWVGKKAMALILPTPNGQNKMIVLQPIVTANELPAKTKKDEVAWDE